MTRIVAAFVRTRLDSAWTLIVAAHSSMKPRVANDSGRFVDGLRSQLPVGNDCGYLAA